MTLSNLSLQNSLHISPFHRPDHHLAAGQPRNRPTPHGATAEKRTYLDPFVLDATGVMFQRYRCPVRVGAEPRAQISELRQRCRPRLRRSSRGIHHSSGFDVKIKDADMYYGTYPTYIHSTCSLLSNITYVLEYYYYYYIFNRTSR